MELIRKRPAIVSTTPTTISLRAAMQRKTKEKRGDLVDPRPIFPPVRVSVCVCMRVLPLLLLLLLFLFIFVFVFCFFLFLALFFSFLSEVNTLGSPGSMKEECQLGALYWSVAMPISSSASPDMNLNIGFPILMLSLVWFVNLFKESRRISNNPIQSFRRGFLRPINCDASDDVAENPQSIWKAQMAECW